MSNSEKYIPKVGDTVLTDLGTECLVLYVGKEHVFVKSDSEEFSADFDYFEPILGKADVEREQLTRLISDSYSRCTGPDYCAKNIIKAGFTIPKKVKRSEIADVVANTSPMISVEDLVDEICNLLGDLVEE